MTYFLRHNPEEGKLSIDKNGWVPLTEFLQKLGLHEADVREVVINCPKRRFGLKNEFGIEYIRAQQGHSTDAVEIEFEPATPATALYHGTTNERFEKIHASGGLKPMNRHHVHLSGDLPTAENVARRWRGETPVILKIDATRMAKNGFKFYRSGNGVWLTDSVPLEYINYRPL